jgi:uncharacterized protein
LNLYLDASALVKRYVAEPGSDLVRETMQRADAWFICRIGFVETARAVESVAGPAAARRFRDEWPAFTVVDVDEDLVEDAWRLAVRHGLRSLDSMHLAAALLLPRDGLVMAGWDGRLRAAAMAQGLAILPEELE